VVSNPPPPAIDSPLEREIKGEREGERETVGERERERRERER
jgi:hypothetical protein